MEGKHSRRRENSKDPKAREQPGGQCDWSREGRKAGEARLGWERGEVTERLAATARFSTVSLKGVENGHEMSDLKLLWLLCSKEGQKQAYLFGGLCSKPSVTESKFIPPTP